MRSRTKTYTLREGSRYPLDPCGREFTGVSRRGRSRTLRGGMRLLRERGARGIQVGGSPPDGVLSLLDKKGGRK